MKKVINGINKVLEITYNYVIKKFNNSVSNDILKKCVAKI